MRADLTRLKEFIRPTTEAVVRESMKAYDCTPDEPGFVSAVEFEQRDDYLTCAHAVARKEAQMEARNFATA